MGLRNLSLSLYRVICDRKKIWDSLLYASSEMSGVTQRDIDQTVQLFAKALQVAMPELDGLSAGS